MPFFTEHIYVMQAKILSDITNNNVFIRDYIYSPVTSGHANRSRTYKSCSLSCTVYRQASWTTEQWNPTRTATDRWMRWIM